MIYTVTLSPALDYLIWLDQFEEGGLNRTEKTAFRAGGKGINVSVVLSRLGYQSICLGFTAGFVGAELVRMLDADGIKHDFIPVADGCSRINVKIKSKTESEINAYGPRVSDKELESLVKQAEGLAAGDILILSGNPPKNLPADIYSVLINAVSGKHIRIALDTSGKHLNSALDKKPWLIKPNKAELEEIFETEFSSVSQIADAAVKLRERGAENVLVSLGPDGALLASEDGGVYTCAVPAGQLIDSTGAGDSMVAGFVAKKLSGSEAVECLRYAVACGCASSYSYDLLELPFLDQVYSRTPLPETVY